MSLGVRKAHNWRKVVSVFVVMGVLCGAVLVGSAVYLKSARAAELSMDDFVFTVKTDNPEGSNISCAGINNKTSC